VVSCTIKGDTTYNILLYTTPLEPLTPSRLFFPLKTEPWGTFSSSPLLITLCEPAFSLPFLQLAYDLRYYTDTSLLPRSLDFLANDSCLIDRACFRPLCDRHFPRLKGSNRITSDAVWGALLRRDRACCCHPSPKLSYISHISTNGDSNISLPRWSLKTVYPSAQ
jgi:hypothetical protein